MIKRETKLHLFFFQLLIVFGTSCSDRFCNRFTSAVKTLCDGSNDSCYITLGKVFDFEWDSLYVFDSELYPEEVSKRLGLDCKCKIIPDGHRRIYFAKGGKIVDQYLSKCYKVNFVLMRENGVVVTNPGTTFLLEKRLVNNEFSYYLFEQ